MIFRGSILDCDFSSSIFPPQFCRRANGEPYTRRYETSNSDTYSSSKQQMSSIGDLAQKIDSIKRSTDQDMSHNKSQNMTKTRKSIDLESGYHENSYQSESNKRFKASSSTLDVANVKTQITSKQGETLLSPIENSRKEKNLSEVDMKNKRKLANTESGEASLSVPNNVSMSNSRSTPRLQKDQVPYSDNYRSTLRLQKGQVSNSEKSRSTLRLLRSSSPKDNSIIENNENDENNQHSVSTNSDQETSED